MIEFTFILVYDAIRRASAIQMLYKKIIFLLIFTSVTGAWRLFVSNFDKFKYCYRIKGSVSLSQNLFFFFLLNNKKVQYGTHWILCWLLSLIQWSSYTHYRTLGAIPHHIEQPLYHTLGNLSEYIPLIIRFFCVFHWGNPRPLTVLRIVMLYSAFMYQDSCSE